MRKFTPLFTLAVVGALAVATSVPLANAPAPSIGAVERLAPIGAVERLAPIGAVERLDQARPAAPQTAAPRRLTSPKEEWGHNLGDDYFLANYQQLTAYWNKLAKESDRIRLEDIGPTGMKKRQTMAIVTAPENLKNLARYKEISRRFSLAEGLTDD